MDSVHARALRPWERQKLYALKRQNGNQVNARHARMILLSRGGMSNRQIAERVDCTPQWVRQILHRFNERSLSAIEWYPYYCRRPGPIKFLADVVEQIVQIALSPPKALIGMNGWSVPKLRDYLIEQKIVGAISARWLSEILRRHHVRLRRTQTWKESTDPLFESRYRAVRRLYTHPPKNGRVICVDEFGPLNLQPRHGFHFVGPGRGVTRHRAAYHRTGEVHHFLGAYDLQKDRLFGRFVAQKNGTTFWPFLKSLRRRYRHIPWLYVILDQAAYHQMVPMRTWARRHRVKLVFTPSGASWLNRIECHFTAMRKFALDNSDFRSHQEQQEAIEGYLTWRNGQRDLSRQTWNAYRSKLQTRRSVA